MSIPRASSGPTAGSCSATESKPLRKPDEGRYGLTVADGHKTSLSWGLSRPEWPELPHRCREGRGFTSVESVKPEPLSETVSFSAVAQGLTSTRDRHAWSRE